MAEQDHEIFVDADEGFSNEKNSYEVLILKQMYECVKVLSKDMTPGQVVQKSGSAGVDRYMEDVNELIINHVDTLRMLLSIYLKKDYLDKIKSIIKEIDDEKQNMQNREVIVPGVGKRRLGDVKGLSSNSIHWREFIDFKAYKHREMFEVLVNCYNQNKEHIRSLEQE